MTRHDTIIAGRGARRRTVRVERRRRPWTDAEIRGAGLTAVGDALFRMGGALSGRDVARILAERRAKVLPGDALKCQQTAAVCQPGRSMCQAKPAPVTTSDPVLSTGALADDVCRHIWTERGRFAPELYGSGM